MRSRSSEAVFAALNESTIVGTLRGANRVRKTVGKHKATYAKGLATVVAARAIYRFGEKKVMHRNPGLAKDHANTAKAMSKVSAGKAVKASNFVSRRYHVRNAERYAKGAKRYSGYAKTADKKTEYHNKKIRKGLRRWEAVSDGVNEGLKLGLAKAAIASANPIAHVSSAKKIGKSIGKKLVGEAVTANASWLEFVNRDKRRRGASNRITKPI